VDEGEEQVVDDDDEHVVDEGGGSGARRGRPEGDRSRGDELVGTTAGIALAA
jgi:hypothetical protein